MEGDHSFSAEQGSVSSLALSGKEVALRFRKIDEFGEHPLTPEYSSAAWKHEAERFGLWADNLGLYHGGHSSLDYRLREADALEAFVRNLLTDLNKSLNEGKVARSESFRKLTRL
jgi:hypothetical protein